MTVYSDGLAEYEADANGDVAVTLVRAVGDLSRNDLPERPGPRGLAGADAGGADARPVRRGAGGVPARPRNADTVDLIERTADDVLLPLVGTTLRSAIADYPCDAKASSSRAEAWPSRRRRRARMASGSCCVA